VGVVKVRGVEALFCVVGAEVAQVCLGRFWFDSLYKVGEPRKYIVQRCWEGVPWGIGDECEV